MILAAHSKKAPVISERKLGPFCSSSSWPLLADVSKRGRRGVTLRCGEKAEESKGEIPQHQKGAGWSSVGAMILHRILGRWLEPHWGPGWGGVEWLGFPEERWTLDTGLLVPTVKLKQLCKGWMTDRQGQWGTADQRPGLCFLSPM